MKEVDLYDIVNYLGKDYKKVGDELVYQCPLCAQKGRDNHKDNLHLNPNKNILWCFADDKHGGAILKQIYHSKYPTEPKPTKRYSGLQNQFMIYQILCNNLLLGVSIDDFILQIMYEKMYNEDEIKKLLDWQKNDHAEKARRYLKNKIGINTSTIELTGLGFDPIDRKWVFPIFNALAELVGFEYRKDNLDIKQIWREKGTPKCMAWVYGSGKKCLICEGYKDSYSMIEILKYFNKLDEYTIVTPSNGVSCCLEVITDLNFSKFESIGLCLDNDSVSQNDTKKIIARYPFIIDKTPQFTEEEKQHHCKDVNDLWMYRYFTQQKTP